MAQSQTEGQSQVEYQLSGVQIAAFFIQPPNERLEKVNLGVQTSLDFGVMPDSFSITAKMKLAILLKGVEICSITTACHFTVSNISSMEAETISTALDLSYLSEVTHSTTRGILLEKLSSTSLQGMALPLLYKNGLREQYG